jgi:hypothetical protein
MQTCEDATDPGESAGAEHQHDSRQTDQDATSEA